MERREPIIDHEVLAEATNVSVARCALGFTLYLDEPLLWARDAAARAFEAFLLRAPIERLEWYTTSMIDRWIRTSPATVAALAEALPVGWNAGHPRHLFSFRLADSVHAPECWFTYREVDPRIERRAGFLSVGFPPSTPSRALLDYVMSIAEAEPYLCGTAGYLGSFNAWDKPTAFTVFHRWAKRFLALDLQDPDRFGWVAGRGLTTTSWLTLIGRPLLERLDASTAGLVHRRFRHNVEVVELRGGTCVRAGSTPTLGDVNQLEFPAAYAEAARALEPFMAPELPPLFGPFYAEDETAKWRRRLVEPEEWR